MNMNPVEIEQAVSDLFAAPFDPQEFPFRFLEAFGNKSTTIRRLRGGTTNRSDLGGVLQTSNIHIKVCEAGAVEETLAALKDSPAGRKSRVKFSLATDGVRVEAVDHAADNFVSCAYHEVPDHFGLFLPLAGISTVPQIRNSAFDVKATGRLNKLYMELLKDNPDWDAAERRPAMNHFMARLIFCFFAEDTDIFPQNDLFTGTVRRMSQPDSADTHTIIATIFRAMNTATAERTAPTDRTGADLPRWVRDFPYVNGGLFAGDPAVPRFSKSARSYLLNIGGLDWKKINPDIFGSMIQAIADEAERGALGLHYTSVPNILNVLNPLFLDDLRARLAAARGNHRKLAYLRNRLARIRVFDPACGSGNFLVIAYKQLREIEADINQQRGEPTRRTEIALTNFRGIELRDFAAEIARLALIIAEYQCDECYRGQQEALSEFLPLSHENWIVCGNALRLDWHTVCPPMGRSVQNKGEDLLHIPSEGTEIDFDNDGGETYICGNPPYKGSQTQSREQKADLAHVFDPFGISPKQIDYVGGWFMKAAAYARHAAADIAFVSTNSICQGRIVPILWPKILRDGLHIHFAHTSFKWGNLARHNAGVIVVIVGLSNRPDRSGRRLFAPGEDGSTTGRDVANINAYLLAAPDVIVRKASHPISALANMSFGNMPVDGGHLLMSATERQALGLTRAQEARLVRRIYGSAEFIRGLVRYCLWIGDEHRDEAMAIPAIAERLAGVRAMRLASHAKGTNAMASRAHQMHGMHTGTKHTIVIPRVSSENRPWLPVGLLPPGNIVSDLAFALYDAPLWNLALLASRLHLVWVMTVCGKLKTDFRYSNTLGWNTFPVPTLTERNRDDLTRCAEDIVLAREAHFPATIADLYDPKRAMPEHLHHVHTRNDETVERIYIGRLFRNDTERLEHLFQRYTTMTTKPQPRKQAGTFPHDR